MDTIVAKKPLLANYAYRIREERHSGSEHLFCASEIPEKLFDKLMREASGLPLGDHDTLREVTDWWRGIYDSRFDWEMNLASESDHTHKQGRSPGLTFHMLANHRYASETAATNSDGPLIRVLCFCDEVGQVHYTEVASGSPNMGSRMDARHNFKEVMKPNRRPAYTTG